MFKTSKFSYGGSAAVVTSTALVIGLTAAGAVKSIIISTLLIAALADNLTDALSFHIFQESEQIDQKIVLTGTVTNFFSRLLLCFTFILLILFLPLAYAATVSMAWGMILLIVITYLVARERKIMALPEIFKHLIIAFVVISVSMMTGHWISIVIR